MRRLPSLSEAVEVGACVPPAERFDRQVVAVLEGEDPLREVVEVGEVTGCDRFALQDREVDLDLVGPGRVDRSRGQPTLPTPDHRGLGDRRLRGVLPEGSTSRMKSPPACTSTVATSASADTIAPPRRHDGKRPSRHAHHVADAHSRSRRPQCGSHTHRVPDALSWRRSQLVSATSGEGEEVVVARKSYARLSSEAITFCSPAAPSNLVDWRCIRRGCSGQRPEW